MAKPRKSFYETKNYNPVQSAASTVGKYFGNIKKEIGQLRKTGQKLDVARYEATTFPPDKRPALNAKANRLREKLDKDRGQLAGAIFLGKKYDKKGRAK